MRPALAFNDPAIEHETYVSAVFNDLIDRASDWGLTEAVNYLLGRDWPPRVLALYLPEAYERVKIFHRTHVDNRSAAA